MHKSLFLTALTTSMRSLQVDALTRYPRWTEFHSRYSKVMLTPSPRMRRLMMFYTLSQSQLGHGGGTLSHVWSTARESTGIVVNAEEESLFVWQDFLKPCAARQTATCLARVTEKVNPRELPWSHEICKYASTLACVRSHSLGIMQEVRQWSSNLTLYEIFMRYLLIQLEDISQIAIEVYPIQQSRVLLRY